MSGFFITWVFFKVKSGVFLHSVATLVQTTTSTTDNIKTAS